jgi:hypothetical protein
MGYRSEVVLAIEPEAASAFMALCAKKPEVLEMCQEADQFVSGRSQEGDWFMHWSCIKWYGDSDAVAALSAFIEALDSDDLTDYGEPDPPRCPNGNGTTQWHEYFKFIRVGEDDDDIERLGWAFDDIGTTRSISF